MHKIKITWLCLFKAIFSVVFVHFCFFAGYSFCIDITFFINNRFQKYLYFSQLVALVVSVSLARWILFFEKEKNESAEQGTARENEVKNIALKNDFSDISEKNFFSMFAMLFCFLAIFYIVDNTLFLLELYDRHGVEILGNIWHFASFEFPYAFSLFLFISALIFIKNLFLKKRIAFFIDILIIGISIFVIISYLPHIYSYHTRSMLLRSLLR